MKRTVRTQQYNRHRGFSLIELLLVLAILGVLAAIVVPKLGGQSEKARITTTRTQIGNLSTALSNFEIDNGRYPSTSEGLKALVEKPSNAIGWEQPYIESGVVPKDPWGNDYIYVYPGTRNQYGYDLYSAGPDQNQGSEDDIYQYEQNER